MQDILNLAPLPADARIPYGSDPNQFADLRLPRGKGPFPVVVNIHGGYWRARYDLTHAGHLCMALTNLGFATWNLEYRRVGNPGGGWPGSFEDLTQGFLHLRLIAKERLLDLNRAVLMGHSAGGELALILAAHQASVRGVISLAGVLDLRRAHDLKLSNDAVSEFLGGPPERVADHYREADPMQVPIARMPQRIIHGINDNVVPVDFSRHYCDIKQKAGESVRLIEVEKAGHFELIDPRVDAWKKVEDAVRELIALT